MPTTYLSRTALEYLDLAQRELNRHLATGSDGRCHTCHHEVPCPRRIQLSAVFAHYGALPVRTPGLARIRP